VRTTATLEPLVDSLAPLILPLLLLVVFYFLVLRPARTRQRDVAALQASLEVGTAVMLTSGLYGQLAHVGETTIRLRIAAQTEITVHRQAVAKQIAEEDLAELRAEGSVVWERV
jgi:preprotein translocase subunit YajC